MLDTEALVRTGRDCLSAIKRCFPTVQESGDGEGAFPTVAPERRVLVFEAAEQFWRALDVTPIPADHPPFIDSEEQGIQTKARRDLWNGLQAWLGRWGWGLFLEEPTLRLPAQAFQREDVFASELKYMESALARLKPIRRVTRTDNAERDSWIYNRYANGDKLSEILGDLKSHKDWNPIDHATGIQEAIKDRQFNNFPVS
jgi:hypothetical protein